MNINAFLRLLGHVTGPNASGEWMARCPCHDDRTASLSVTVRRDGGRDRIVFDCHAGCAGTDILAALGLRTGQLYDPERAAAPGNGKKGAAGSGAGGPGAGAKGAKGAKGAGGPGADGERVETLPNGQKVHTVPKAAQADEGPTWDLSRPARVYSYTDPDGRELFQVCRFEQEWQGKRIKTFRQRRRDPGNPKANAGGWVWSVPEEIRNAALYNLPAVVRAIGAGETVYLVEGEKDVETMARLGYTATCNPGGAGVGKWRDGYTRILNGADVVILPDNDPENKEDPDKGRTGQKHAWAAACALNGHAKRVRIVDLTRCCAELPDKGDISDMAVILGDREAADALKRELAQTVDFDPGMPMWWLTPIEQATALYENVQGYGIRSGCLGQWQAGGAFKPLSDFVPIMRMELIRDDGANTSMSFVLDGWQRTGRPLPRVTVSADELDRMGWVTARWGTHASVSPGSTNGAKVAWAIKQVGQRTAKRTTEYLHSGWRKINGTWCYLYHGGAIGMDGVTVDMGEALKTYRLGGPEEISYEAGCEKSLAIARILKPELATALLGVTYLAPLREWMSQTDTVPAFSLFLHGITGTHKSTAAALALAHFGNFHAKNPPASFNDTANQIRKKAFLVKDMPLLVDDYHPTNSLQEARQMTATAQAISRAFGDGSDRGRLNADRSVSASNPPRSVAIITGEDLPAVGESGLARYYVVEVGKGDVPVTAELTALQEAAREGYLQRAMRGYIVWLSRQTDTLPERLHEMFLTCRDTVRQMITGVHDRAPESLACLLIGYSMMLSYMRDIGVIDAASVTRMTGQAYRILTEATRRQAKDMQSQKPSVLFLTALSELLASRDAAVYDLSNPEVKGEPMHMIGYCDREYYYLLPSVAFSAVSELLRKQETRFPVTLKGLYKHLKEDGVCGDAVTEESITRNKRINGKAVRVLWIPRSRIDGDGGAKQLAMDGFVPADPGDSPFGP